MFSEAELNQLFRYCLTLSKEEASAYDLLQDGLESYLKKQTNQTIDKPLNYLRCIIRNRFIDTLRKEQRNPLTMVEDTDTYQVTEIGFQSLEQIQTSQQTLENIWKKLQPLERELMHFWAVEEWTAQEIADHLKIPRGTILARIHRLRKRIVGFNLDSNTTNKEAG
jgi:RNA polymerase sigma-70 factor (ECF subfamily)